MKYLNVKLTINPTNHAKLININLFQPVKNLENSKFNYSSPPFIPNYNRFKMHDENTYFCWDIQNFWWTVWVMNDIIVKYCWQIKFSCEFCESHILYPVHDMWGLLLKSSYYNTLYITSCKWYMISLCLPHVLCFHSMFYLSMLMICQLRVNLGSS